MEGFCLTKNLRESNRKDLFKKLLEGDFSYFRMANSIPKIEDYMRNNNNYISLFGLVSLHNRFWFLTTLGGVTRSESIFKADFIDLCDLKIHANYEKDPYHILLIIIGEYKTVKDKPIYCKSLRRRDPWLYSIGSWGLYHLERFHYFNEWKKLDFSNSNFWFNIKLLISSKATSSQSNGKYMVTIIFNVCLLINCTYTTISIYCIYIFDKENKISACYCIIRKLYIHDII